MSFPTQNACAPRNRMKRNILAAAVTLSLLLAVAHCTWSQLKPLAPGKGAAGPAVPSEPFSEVWTKRPVVLLGLGDSITDGFGASRGKSYFDRLVANPADEFEDMRGRNLSAVFPNLRPRNESVSGSTSFHCLEKQLPRLKPADMDTLGIVVITTGGNDLIHNYGQTPPQRDAMYGATMEQAVPWIAGYEKRLDKIIGKVTALFPGGCYILLANIYDPSDGMGDPEAIGLPPWKDLVKILGAYNDVITDCAQKHDNVWLVDIHGPFLGHGVHCAEPQNKHYDANDPHYWYYPNIEDPNDRGYDAIRRLFLLTMLKAYEEQPHMTGKLVLDAS